MERKFSLTGFFTKTLLAYLKKEWCAHFGMALFPSWAGSSPTKDLWSQIEDIQREKGGFG